jgi:pyruvate,water dikinase
VPGQTRVDDDDPLNDDTPEGVLWTRVNVSEAVPGVLTPITWSFYGELVESGARRGFHDLGVLPRSEVPYPAAVGMRMFGVFAGRYATNVGVIRTQFSALPGVSGDDVERDMLGSIREGVRDPDPGFRLPAIALRMPPKLLRAGHNSIRCRQSYGRWWSSRVDRGGLVGPGAARDTLHESAERFLAALRLQAHGRLMYSGTTSALLDLATKAGRPELFPRLLAGVGDIEETVVADDLWLLAAGRLDLDTFLARHGYHGPTVGEIAARSWREDPAPVMRLLATVRDTEAPSVRRGPIQAQRREAAAEVLAALPRHSRPAARAVLRVAPAAAISLQRTKAAFLMSLDVARAAVRRIGADLVAAGVVDDPGDAFQFFLPELLDPAPGDQRERVRRRNAARERYQAVEVPETWSGPVPAKPRAAVVRDPAVRAAAVRDAAVRAAAVGDAAVGDAAVGDAAVGDAAVGDAGQRTTGQRITGLGVAAGTATGRARVVLDPADDTGLDVGDVLVCHTTDPSWVALMTVAGALVIDVGGAASHGAVVARELGIPCVIGTHTGTLIVPDGARITVDGSTGTIDVLPPPHQG